MAKASPYAVNLELSVHDETDSNSYYHVDVEGTIGWGGAMQALLSETVWTGPMSDEERKQLHDLLIEHHWFDRDPVSTNEPKKRIYRATVSGVEGSNRFTVKGANDDVQPIADFLAQICRRRLNPELEKLPQPGLQKR